MMSSFINPVFLYGLEYIFAVMALCALGVVAFAVQRRFMMAVVCAVLLAGVAATIPVYIDTVLRAQDAEAPVIRLWGKAYPGTFALTAEGEPGLPPFVKATKARLIEFMPGTPDWFRFSDECLRRVEGRDGDKRRYELALISGVLETPPEQCRGFEAIKDAFGVDLEKILARDYERLRAYAAKVAAADRTAQEICPPFFTDRGRYQKQELNKRTGMMEKPYDLSGIKCACVALGRHQGCRALSERDSKEGYVADFWKYDFFTPLTCDQSELCTVLRRYVTLANEAPDVPEAEKEALIKNAVGQCIAAEQFSPERRESLCGCSIRMLAGQDPRFTRLGASAAQCLQDFGYLDDDKCVIGEADWNAQREAVTACVVEGG